MIINFEGGVIKIMTKGAVINTYYKIYYGAIRGAVYPSNYNADLDAFDGLTISINGDVYEIPNAAELQVNDTYPGDVLDCLAALVAQLSIYTYTNPAY